MRSISVLVVGVVCTALTLCTPKKQVPSEAPVVVTQEVNGLPAVILIDPTGKTFSARELPGNTILIFFGATCDHCQREATAIHNNLKAFQNYTLYFIAMDPFPVIKKFADDYGISNQSNIRFLRADGASVSSALGYLQTPTIFVYGGDRKLTKRFDGETDVKEIIKSL